MLSRGQGGDRAVAPASRRIARSARLLVASEVSELSAQRRKLAQVPLNSRLVDRLKNRRSKSCALSSDTSGLVGHGVHDVGDVDGWGTGKSDIILEPIRQADDQ